VVVDVAQQRPGGRAEVRLTDSASGLVVGRFAPPPIQRHRSRPDAFVFSITELSGLRVMDTHERAACDALLSAVRRIDVEEGGIFSAPAGVPRAGVWRRRCVAAPTIDDLDTVQTEDFATHASFVAALRALFTRALEQDAFPGLSRVYPTFAIARAESYAHARVLVALVDAEPALRSTTATPITLSLSRLDATTVSAWGAAVASNAALARRSALAADGAALDCLVRRGGYARRADVVRAQRLCWLRSLALLRIERVCARVAPRTRRAANEAFNHHAVARGVIAFAAPTQALRPGRVLWGRGHGDEGAASDAALRGFASSEALHALRDLREGVWDTRGARGEAVFPINGVLDELTLRALVMADESDTTIPNPSAEIVMETKQTKKVDELVPGGASDTATNAAAAGADGDGDGATRAGAEDAAPSAVRVVAQRSAARGAMLPAGIELSWRAPQHALVAIAPSGPYTIAAQCIGRSAATVERWARVAEERRDSTVITDEQAARFEGLGILDHEAFKRDPPRVLVTGLASAECGLIGSFEQLRAERRAAGRRPGTGGATAHVARVNFDVGYTHPGAGASAECDARNLVAVGEAAGVCAEAAPWRELRLDASVLHFFCLLVLFLLLIYSFFVRTSKVSAARRCGRASRPCRRRARARPLGARRVRSPAAAPPRTAARRAAQRAARVGLRAAQRQVGHGRSGECSFIYRYILREPC
jgi:hypothetical protein